MTMGYEQIFAQRVREQRLHLKLTQKELGEAVGLTHKAISTIETGVHTTTMDRLVALAQFFHVSIDYLVGLKDEP